MGLGLVAAVVMLGLGLGLSGREVATARSEQQLQQKAADKQQQPKKKKSQKKKGQKKGQKKNQKNQAAARRQRANRPVGRFQQEFLDAAQQGGAAVLSVGDSFDDFASIVEAGDGTVYAAYAAYFDAGDQVRVHRRLDNGRWSTHSPVPLAEPRSDVWMPQVATDGDNRLWVIWAEQIGRSAHRTGNWDLFARQRANNQWGPLVRLTDNPKPDINPHVTSDRRGRIHVTWQAHPDNNGDIQYCFFDGTRWSKPLAVTDDEHSDWYPRVAVGADGTAWIAFDSYCNGDYDVLLTSVQDGEPGPVIPVAASKFYEAHASVAAAPDGTVWVAWEQGGYNWGKDQGYWLKRENRNQGSSLGNTRSVRVAAVVDGQVRGTPDLAEAIPQGSRRLPRAMGGIVAGRDGRVWLRFRGLVRGLLRRPGRFTRGWVEQVPWLTADGWAKPELLPASTGRISVFSRSWPAADGSLLVAYSSDARSPVNFHRPIRDNVLVKQLAAPQGDPARPRLGDYQPPEPPAVIAAWNTRRENQQVAAIRKHRVTIDGKSHRIVRGDLHRHTELSWDVGPGNDGSFLDFYRYMIDVAAMDFGGLTDHQGGGHYPYWWWLTEKSCDMYYLAPRFVPLYSYERSARFPDGHRNIFHSYRGVPIFPFQLRLDQTNVFPGVGTGALVSNDTKLLYEYLHRSGGLSIPHTSGTPSMGTDWRDNDPVIEPVVEIYQGARNSYEALDAPRVHSKDEPPARAPGGFQAKGLLWNAYSKGYRLGTIASSDHGSTHISYALVYTPRNDRQAILDAIRRRQTYGATDNIILSVHANGRFMGSEYELKPGDRPTLELKVTGTSRITKIDLVRNNAYVYSAKGDGNDAEVKYTDMKPADGWNLYYFRVTQDDGEIAWASPVWVKVTAAK